MNEIDRRLREKIKMLDEIDKMIKSAPQNTDSAATSKRDLDKSNLSHDYDFPLQTNKESKMFSTKDHTEPYPSKKDFVSRDRENISLTKPTLKSAQRAASKTVTKKQNPKPQHRNTPKVTESKMVNINININNKNGIPEVGDRLYNWAFFMKEKMERKREEDKVEKLRNMTPKITTRAKSIQRDATRFYDRLYPSHKIKAKENCKDIEETYRENITHKNFHSNFDYSPSHNNHLINKDISADSPDHIYNVNLNTNPLRNITGYYPSNSFTPSPDKLTYGNFNSKNNFEEFVNYGNYNNYISNTPNFEEDKEMIKIYRKESPKQKSSYKYKPKLDKNSLKIAQNLTPAKERLVAKKKKFKKPEETYVNTSVDIKSNRSKTRSRSPANRTDDLYNLGLEKYKKREIIHMQKKVLDNEEFRKYSYRPVINSPSPIASGRIDNSTRNILRDSNDSQPSPSRQFYEKTNHWKKNVGYRKEKRKLTLEKEMKEVYTFKPKITKEVPANDEKFITHHLDQIEDYVTRRRNMILKKKEEENYLKKKFLTGENFKCKATVPQEFNLMTEFRGRSKSRDTKQRDKSNVKESRSPVYYTNHQCMARNNSKKSLQVNRMRDQLKTGDFFNPDRDNSCLYSDSNLGQENSMHVFMNAINNLHDQLVNFKI